MRALLQRVSRASVEVDAFSLRSGEGFNFRVAAHRDDLTVMDGDSLCNRIVGIGRQDVPVYKYSLSGQPARPCAAVSREEYDHKAHENTEITTACKSHLIHDLHFGHPDTNSIAEPPLR